MKILRESGPGIYEVEVEGKLDYVYGEFIYVVGPFPLKLSLEVARSNEYVDLTKD